MIAQSLFVFMLSKKGGLETIKGKIPNLENGGRFLNKG